MRLVINIGDSKLPALLRFLQQHEEEVELVGAGPKEGARLSEEQEEWLEKI